MPALKLSQLAEATGGSLIAGDANAVVENFTQDTRRIKPNGAFFALSGERSDGHTFLGDAAKRGATAAVIAHEPAPDQRTPAALIRVDDVAQSLLNCGRWIRNKYTGVRWIGLTGSNGKTTTKELIAAGLSANRRIHKTPGNYNNHLGVPLTLLALPEDTEIAVVELAMSGPGEIAMLAEMIDPDVALVTNVHAVHMAFFRNLDDVAAAKGELFAVLRDDATSVVNLDEMQVRVQASRHPGPRVTFGRHPAADLRLEHVENQFAPGAVMVVRERERTIRMQLRMGGAHAAFNTLAALATVAAAGEDIEAAAGRMEQLEPGPGRGRILTLDHGMLLVDDSYNSSPPALAAVLETFRLTEHAGRKVLILGDMLELGPMEEALHREAGRRAAAAGVTVLIGVGPLSREAAEAARRAGVREVHHHNDAKSAARSIGDFLRPQDLILVKGSRGVRLEQVVQALSRAFERAR